MKRLIVAAALCMTAAQAGWAQDLRENSMRSLFSDQKALRPGDAITIIVVEASSASNDANTTGSRESSIGFSASGTTGDKSLGSGSLSLGSQNQFKGSGATASHGSVQARISARVDSLAPNGNLYVNGIRTISINGKDQVIRISGIVRPADIQTDNSVYSYNIAEATIVFEGSGIVAQSQEPGWLTKLFHWLF